MARKIIKVVFAGEGDTIPTKLNKNFASYAALMRKLEIGQTVTVAVYNRDKVLGDMLQGYGDVTRRTLTGYTVPRVLRHDY